MPTLPDFGSELFWARFSTRLSAAIRENRITEELICELCSVSPQTVKHWRKGTANPSTENVFRIMSVLGPRFANDMLGLIGMGGAQEIEPGSEVESALRSAQEQLSRADALIERNHRPEGEMQRVVSLTAEILYLISRLHRRVMPAVDEMAERRVPRQVR